LATDRASKLSMVLAFSVLATLIDFQSDRRQI
jgi:hypothetical protein